MRRVTRALAWLSSALIACAEEPVPEPAVARPWLQTDSPAYTLQQDGQGWTTIIGYTYVNAGMDTVYVTNCNAHVVMSLQKLEAATWQDFWMGETDGCLSAPLIIAPGEKYRGKLAIWGAEPGTTSYNTFKSAVFDGRFRLMWYQPRLHYDVRAANFGDTMAIAYRHSNEFTLRKGGT